MADFDPDKYIAEKSGQAFDPDAYLREKLGGFAGSRAGVGLPAEPKGPGAIASAGRGALQGATLGFGDELQGAMGAGAQFLGEHPLLQRVATGQYFQPEKDLPFQPAENEHHQPLSPLDVYRELRDEDRQVSDAAAHAHPGAYLGGSIAGALATAKPVSALTKTLPLLGGATRLSRIGQGVALGGVAGLGGSTARTPGQQLLDAIGVTGAEQAAKDIGEGNKGRALLDLLGSGALGGGVAGTAAEALPTLVRGIGSRLEKGGISQAKRAIYNVTNGLAARKELPDSAAQAALQENAIRPFGTAHGNAARLADVAAREGERLGQAIQTLEAGGVRVPTDPLAAKLNGMASSASANTLNAQVPKVYANTAETVGALGMADQPFGLAEGALGKKPSPTLGLQQMENLKRSAQEDALSSYKQLHPKEIGKAKEAAASILRQASEDAVNRAKLGAPMGSDLDLAADSFLEAKHRLADLLPARNEAEIGAARGGRRSLFGLAGHEMMAEGLGSGDPAAAGKSLLGALINTGFHHMGPSTMASGLYWTGKALRKGAPLLSGPTAPMLADALQRGLLLGEQDPLANQLSLAEALRSGR